MEMLIKEHGWNNTYFSSLFGKSRQWITDMKKKGLGIPDENMLQSIADKLDTTVDYLTDQTDKKNKPAAKRDELKEEILNLFTGLSSEDKKELIDFARYKVEHQSEK